MPMTASLLDVLREIDTLAPDNGFIRSGAGTVNSSVLYVVVKEPLRSTAVFTPWNPAFEDIVQGRLHRLCEARGWGCVIGNRYGGDQPHVYASVRFGLSSHVDTSAATPAHALALAVVEALRAASL